MVVSISFRRWKTWLAQAQQWPFGATGTSTNARGAGQAAWVQRVPRNQRGRDFAVGDIHGCFGKLRRALKEVNFDPTADRLFSVGDLVDRGPESSEVLDWLKQPWFFAVCGNHEYMTWRSASGQPFETLDHRRHGGEWLDALCAAERAAIGARLRILPLALEVETGRGMVGLVHAACPGNDWRVMHRLDLGQLHDLHSEAGQCLWSTQRAMLCDDTPVRNIRAVIHGHITVSRHLQLGNVHFIDTGGWRPQGKFTLLELETLSPILAGQTVEQSGPMALV